MIESQWIEDRVHSLKSWKQSEKYLFGIRKMVIEIGAMPFTGPLLFQGELTALKNGLCWPPLPSSESGGRRPPFLEAWQEIHLAPKS